MGTTCIIQGNKGLLTETFIQAHIERLSGDKVVLYNYYPEYIYKGRTIRYFYSKHPLLAKLKKLLPQFLYNRWVTQREQSEETILDFLAGFIKHHNIDVILAEYGFNGADICKDARILNIPLIVHFHGHDAHREPDLAPYKERYRQMFDYAFRIVSVSHFMTEKLIQMGADPSKIIYNPYGPRDYFYDNRSNYKDTFLSVGQFENRKAPHFTLMAFKLLLEEFPNARLVMVGDGPLKEACVSLAKTWGIAEKVSFPGALKHEQIMPLFAEACCFVQHSVTPSYGDAEGTPVAILEAGAAGLPVVSTRHAGITDAVVHGETGFLVEEYDVVGMKNFMRKLIEDKDLCRNMGAKAREHISANYNIKRHIDCLQGLIDEARGRR